MGSPGKTTLLVLPSPGFPGHTGHEPGKSEISVNDKNLAKVAALLDQNNRPPDHQKHSLIDALIQEITLLWLDFQRGKHIQW